MKRGIKYSVIFHAILLGSIVSVEKLGETVACKDWHQFTPKQNSAHQHKDLEAVYTEISQNLKNTETAYSIGVTGLKVYLHWFL